MVLQRKEYGMKLLLIIWQLPQFVLGYAVLLYHFSRNVISYKRFSCEDFKGVDVTVISFCSRKKNFISGFSLGKYIFLYYDNTYEDKYVLNKKIDAAIKHEYGHSVQSAYLGWLYLVVIGIVSLVMTSIGMSKKCYTEKWADKIVAGCKIKIKEI